LPNFEAPAASRASSGLNRLFNRLVHGIHEQVGAPCHGPERLILNKPDPTAMKWQQLRRPPKSIGKTRSVL
ncbi:MAG: hypothetical protein RRY41_10910, partial [Burkholderiaceae bacterium]